MHTHLSIQEREVISQLYAQWLSFSEIWRRINRSHTTIMREINRNWKENRWKMKIKYSCIDADNKAREIKYMERLEHIEKQTMVMLVCTGGGVLALLFTSMTVLMNI